MCRPTIFLTVFCTTTLFYLCVVPRKAGYCNHLHMSVCMSVCSQDNAKIIGPNLTKLSGKIHNGDTKKEFDFGSDRLKVKVKRGQKVKRGKKKHYVKTIGPNLMNFGGKIHNCDRKNEFDFGSDRVKVMRVQQVKRGQNPLRKNYWTKFDEILREDI